MKKLIIYVIMFCFLLITIITPVRSQPILTYPPEIRFPECFYTGKVDYGCFSAEEKKALALADALGAWGCCMAGVEIPEKFGEVMVKLGEILGETLTPETTNRLYKKLLKDFPDFKD